MKLVIAAMAGIGVGRGVSGFSGTLIGLDCREYEAKRHVGRVQNGAILSSVTAVLPVRSTEPSKS
jgi:hypothetical protein